MDEAVSAFVAYKSPNALKKKAAIPNGIKNSPGIKKKVKGQKQKVAKVINNKVVDEMTAAPNSSKAAPPKKKKKKALNVAKDELLGEILPGTTPKSSKINQPKKKGLKKKETAVEADNEPKKDKKRKLSVTEHVSPILENVQADVSTTNGGIKKKAKTIKVNREAIRKNLPKAAKKVKVTKSKPPSISDDAISIDSSSSSKISSVLYQSSINEGLKVLHWLLNPIGVDEFFDQFWEKNACFVSRSSTTFYNKLISFEMIDRMLREHHIEFTKNIDVTSYKNGVRETHNPVGRAMPPVVWESYENGCSIRLLNSQTFLPIMFTLCTTLQEYFHCMVGANAYLTPPNSQGFAPHYDDIEAFVLQIEGSKRWKLYKPRSQDEELPRFSSKNFSSDEIGEPFLEKVLQPGDVLYFPRGTIHQACTEPGSHSLHITLSVYQKHSYADLFECMLPLMLKRIVAECVDMRRGLPLNVWQYAGVVHSDVDSKERTEFLLKCQDLMSRCVNELPIDEAVDQLAKKFQHEALPPDIIPCEVERTIFGSKSKTTESGECIADYDIEAKTNIRLLRANILRLVEEEGKIRIYYYLDNSKEYCEYEPNYIEIDPDDAGSVEMLIKSYPAYIQVSELPQDDIEKKIMVATALWERGLIMFEKRFN